jgi:RimJ/RimL family protein N-acetyltransferase
VIALREARLADAQRVYAWNCAPDVRALSGDARPVSLAEHLRWYAARVKQGSFWIVEADGAPVGTVRLDGDAISIALDASARGRGVGKQAIAAACAGRASVTATVHAENLPSRRAFEACGFTQAATSGAFLTYRWSPT